MRLGWRFRALAIAATALFVAAGALFELRTPERTPWEIVDRGEAAIWRADGLVLQEQHGSSLWASNGFSIYRSRAGGPFEKVHTVVPPLGAIWAGYSRTLRRWSRHHELVEVVPLDDDRLLAFAGGEVHRIDLEAGTDEVTHTLRYFGRGEGRGVMPHGIAVDEEGNVFYGEYPTRRLRPGEDVRIWRSPDEGRTWEVAYTFDAGEARHVHAVRWDPYSDSLWIGTGDRDEHSRVGFSRDGGRTFTWVGRGSQVFRTCSFMFDADSVLWAMDSPTEPPRIVRWDRSSRTLSLEGSPLPSPAYYTQRIDSDRGLVTLAEQDASVWLVEDGAATPLLRWEVEPDPGRPHPSVRLTRSNGENRDWVFMNPLRTEREPAAIYRLWRGSGTTPRTTARLPGTTRTLVP